MTEQLSFLLKQHRLPAPVRQIEFLGGGGGFSGARFWKLTTAEGNYCVRRWPSEHPDPTRLTYIHSVLQHVAQRGFDKIPLPLRCLNGSSFLKHEGHLWELTPWLPGRADFHQQPSDARLQSCLRALAHFHMAASSHRSALTKPQKSPGIEARLQQLEELNAGRLTRIANSIQPGDWPELESRGRTLCEFFAKFAPSTLNILRSSATIDVRLQPAIRDVWHDHVLFQGDELSGIVDFGALRLESVVGDIARLLGSLVGNDQSRWQTGLAAYGEVNRLTSQELSLMKAFDRSGVLLAGMNWLDWIYVQGRWFEDRQRVVDRLDEILERLGRSRCA